jgi:hypothetical protein
MQAAVVLRRIRRRTKAARIIADRGTTPGEARTTTDLETAVQAVRIATVPAERIATVPATRMRIDKVERTTTVRGMQMAIGPGERTTIDLGTRTAIVRVERTITAQAMQMRIGPAAPTAVPAMRVEIARRATALLQDDRLL